jgi:hypothetical protein
MQVVHPAVQVEVANTHCITATSSWHCSFKRTLRSTQSKAFHNDIAISQLQLAHNDRRPHCCTCLSAYFSPILAPACSFFSSIRNTRKTVLKSHQTNILPSLLFRTALHRSRASTSSTWGSCRPARRLFGSMAAEELPTLPDIEDVRTCAI